MTPRAPLGPPLVSTALVVLAALTTACPGDIATDTEAATDDATTGGIVPPPTTVSPPTTTDASSSSTSEPPAETTDASTSTGDDTTTGDATTGELTTLCDRLGATDELAALIVDRLLADDRINGYFLNTSVEPPPLQACLADQLAVAAACEGATYGCMDMQAAHAGLKISSQDFLDFMADVADALADHRVAHPDLTDDDAAALTAALAAPEPDIVEDPTDDLTIYQRVGRKPALRDLVGDPDVDGSFLARVATDPAISGFFAAADFPRLRTCLTRQLAAIDGPVVYGAEVDAPEGVEPGVGAADPCRAMAEVHTGLFDEFQSPITIDDFMALLTALDQAMDAAAFPPPDQEAILGALATLCEPIVPLSNACPGNNIELVVEAKDLALDLKPVDGKYDGTLTTMACVDLEVADDGVNFIADARLTVAMDHTWIGEVTIKLVHPDATILTVLSRPGDPEGTLPDDSSDCCGDDSNFSAAHPFTFRDGVLLSGDEMGAGLANNAIVCKDENPCAWLPFPGLGPGIALADFAGKSAVGTWKACFGDSGAGDFGSVTAVTLELDKIKYQP